MAALFALVPVVLVGVPAVVAAQQQGPPAEDSTELVFQREVFTYPQFERRNPFQPLLGSGEGGPRFAELALLGVIWSPQPPLSVAVLGTGVTFEGGAVAGASGRTYRVREGETLGNARVLEIRQSRVIFEVTEMGMTEQRVLELRRPGGGGSS